MTIIILPWPNANLSPNKRLHWTAKLKHKQSSKDIGYLAGIESGACINYHELVKGRTIPLRVIFYPPSRRRYDLDNLFASMKPTLDGIAQAWNVDDRYFRPITLDFGPVFKDGKVEIYVGE